MSGPELLLILVFEGQTHRLYPPESCPRAHYVTSTAGLYLESESVERAGGELVT